MPIINGVKVSCQPCIRGHRATKCTHANDRELWIVNRPGRPLSACPHPRDRPCNCTSMSTAITAAIPRNQPCHCGGPAPISTTGSLGQYSHPSIGHLPSPTQSVYKVQKPIPRPPSRKQSFDPANFERMNMNNVNVIPFEQRRQSAEIPFQNGYGNTAKPQMYGQVQQNPIMQSQYSHFPVQPPVHVPAYPNGLPSMHGNINTLPRGIPQFGPEHLPEAQPTPPTIREVERLPAELYIGEAPLVPIFNGESNVRTKGSFMTNRLNHNHTSSTSSSTQDFKASSLPSCCSSKSVPEIPKAEPLSGQTSPIMSPEMTHNFPPQNGPRLNQTNYPQAPAQTTFTFPAAYGSFENPINPLRYDAWLSMQDNDYLTPTPLSSAPPLPYTSSIDPNRSGTTHACGCGEGCQCVGCLAHPYNDATKEYVRAAWLEQRPNEAYVNGTSISVGNGNTASPPRAIEHGSSPTAQTPSSSASGNSEDQVLSGDNFLFVDYKIGDCLGAEDFCPCGDECKCIGCEMHNGLGGNVAN